MTIADIFLNWIHVLGAVIFLGAMFLGTFVILPVLKTHLDYEPRHKFILNFIPRVRRIVAVVVALLVLSGVGRALLLHFGHEGPADPARLGVFGAKLFFAALPVVIFLVAPKVLGASSKDGLCCDPDAEPVPALLGVMSDKGAALHYVAISGGWLAVLFGIILSHMG